MQTMHGISEGVSQTDEGGALIGIGQGATDAPAGWLLVSTILSKIYDKQAHGCKVVDPFYKFLIQWSHAMFVDDTYLCHTAPLIDASEKQLKNTVEQDLRSWYSGLHFSGGALNLKKTNYFVLRWEFQDNGAPIVLNRI